MHRSAFAMAASILIANGLAYAGEIATVVFPDGWFLDAEEAGMVFMLRNHGPDLSFDVVDEIGRTIDIVALPTGRTILPQYRVAPGKYEVRFLDQDEEVKARSGEFAAYGVAITELPAAGGKPAAMLPIYAPFANYTAVAMKQRVAPFVAMGTTDLLPPKALNATILEFRLTSESAGGAVAVSGARTLSCGEGRGRPHSSPPEARHLTPSIRRQRFDKKRAHPPTTSAFSANSRQMCTE